MRDRDSADFIVQFRIQSRFRKAGATTINEEPSIRFPWNNILLMPPRHHFTSDCIIICAEHMCIIWNVKEKKKDAVILPYPVSFVVHLPTCVLLWLSSSSSLWLLLPYAAIELQNTTNESTKIYRILSCSAHIIIIHKCRELFSAD